MAGKILLLITALIWGSTFIAQRIASDLIGPNSYNAVRFLMGAIVLLPIIYYFGDSTPRKKPWLPLPAISLLLGFFLFTGSSLQQYALIYTTASKAAFVTALYIVMVPVFGLFLGHRLSYFATAGMITAVIGAALLTLNGEDLTLNYGDAALLISTFFWTGHILLLSDVTQRYPNIKLACGQFLACAIIGAGPSLFIEHLQFSQIEATIIPLLWGGVLSAGIAYTFQLLGQRTVPPTEASLIMSLEMVFAAILGYLILDETLTLKETCGVILITCGVVLAQLPYSRKYSFAPLRKRAN